MSDWIDLVAACNLRRWQESGQPQAWCAARQGQWREADCRELIASLWWSEFWPMETAEVRAVLEALRRAWNLHRWQESGQPRQWVEAHNGRWNHDDWLALLVQLESSEFWPMEAAAVGSLIEELGRQWRNLQAWKHSGLPQQWVDARQALWNHDDWLSLVATLRQSEFWPLDLGAAGQVLDELKLAHGSLVRWQLSGHPRHWVNERRGVWDHGDWLALLDALRQTDFWPLNPDAVGRVLEDVRRQWWNLHRWQESGMARRWVEAHLGMWDHDDWLALLASLHASAYWPVDAEALGQVLEETRAEWRNQAQEVPPPDVWPRLVDPFEPYEDGGEPALGLVFALPETVPREAGRRAA
jgi:hypothetical protein